jgi:hypothetical protein
MFEKTVTKKTLKEKENGLYESQTLSTDDVNTRIKVSIIDGNGKEQTSIIARGAIAMFVGVDDEKSSEGFLSANMFSLGHPELPLPQVAESVLRFIEFMEVRSGLFLRETIEELMNQDGDK